MCGGEVVHAQSDYTIGRWLVHEEVAEDLTEGSAEVLGQEGVEDGVYTGMPIGQAVGDDAKS